MARAQFYRDLGLKRSASQADIKAAYRELARRYHPDKNKEPGAEGKFKRVAAAHETLSDPDKRRMYDAYGGTSHTLNLAHECCSHSRAPAADRGL